MLQTLFPRQLPEHCCRQQPRHRRDSSRLISCQYCAYSTTRCHYERRASKTPNLYMTSRSRQRNYDIKLHCRKWRQNENFANLARTGSREPCSLKTRFITRGSRLLVLGLNAFFCIVSQSFFETLAALTHIDKKGAVDGQGT